MYVCLCNGVTDRDIRAAAEGGVRSLSELTMRTGAASNCGSCASMCVSLLDEVHSVRDLPLPMLSQAA